jgi:pyruvate dehydrogenase E1 component
LSYDPAFSYEIAVIIKDGIQKMFVEQKNYFYYITTMNENYEHPQMPKGAEEGIIKGMYKLLPEKKPAIRLIGSGSILNESIKAKELLKNYDIESEVWSVTSFNLLRKNGMEVERKNQLNPNKKDIKTYVEECFEDDSIPVVASTDYMRAYAEQIRPYVKADYTVLGTDGFGRSDSRKNLREFFEIDATSITRAAAYTLHKNNLLNKTKLKQIYDDLEVDPLKPNPWEV